MSKFVTLTFEVSEDPGPNNGGVHEALCLVIHENDGRALQWLGQNVLDIQVKEGE